VREYRWILGVRRGRRQDMLAPMTTRRTGGRLGYVRMAPRMVGDLRFHVVHCHHAILAQPGRPGHQHADDISCDAATKMG